MDSFHITTAIGGRAGSKRTTTSAGVGRRSASKRRLPANTDSGFACRKGNEMTNRSSTGTTRPTADHSQRKVAFAAAFSLLFIALLAPFAHFGVLQSLIVPADAA